MMLRKFNMNGTVHLEIFSLPQAIENSREYFLLRTDIIQKTVVGCPWFTLRFRTVKGVRTSFFFGFAMAPKSEKTSPDPFHENMVQKVYTAKISGPYQLFYGSGATFFSVV